MTTLKEVNTGFNQFCGPAVLSALTGKSTDECASVISSISGRMEIRAVNTEHLLKALNKLRFNAEVHKIYSYSLYGVLSNLTNGMYIIMVPKHVVAVEVIDRTIYFVDNHTKHVIDAASSARLSQKVDAVYKITAMPQPKFINTEIMVITFKSGYAKIECEDIYEDEKDNILRNIAHVNAKDKTELRLIAAKLLETLNEQDTKDS
jgi:hypothetical protein